MRYGEEGWPGWIRTSQSSVELSAGYSAIDLLDTILSVLSLAGPPTQNQERRTIEGCEVLLEEPDLSLGVWTKLERLRGLYSGLDSLEVSLRDIASNLFGEEANLIKDKINIKKPGPTGFGVHQDMESYRHFPPTRHLTAMVSLIETTTENGCMYFARDYTESIGPEDIQTTIDRGQLLNFVQHGPNRGNLCPSVIAKLQFEDVSTRQDEIVFFDSTIPHGSHDNHSNSDRPTLFLTFAPARFKYTYETYYMEKRSDGRF